MPGFPRRLVILGASMVSCPIALGAGLVPKHIAAPPSDITSGTLRMPDPELTGTESPVAMFRVGDGQNAWTRRIDIPSDASVKMLVVGDVQGLSVRTPDDGELVLANRPSAKQGPGAIYDLGALAKGAWTVSGRGEAVVVLSDGTDAPLYTNLTTHRSIKGEQIGVCARIVEAGRAGGLPIPMDGARIDSATLDFVDANGDSQAIEMFDNGAGLDAAADDGVYTAAVSLDVAGDGVATVRVRASMGGKGRIERTSRILIPTVEQTVRLAQRNASVEAHRRDVIVRIPVDGTARVKVGAELWASTADGDVPAVWIGGIIEPEPDDDGDASVGLIVDPAWVSMLGVPVEELILKNVRVQDVRTSVVLDRADRNAIANAGVMLEKARGIDARGLTPSMLAKHPGDEHAINVETGSVDSARVAGGHNLLLVHGYCSDGSPWPVNDFTGSREVFLDPEANRSHDEFAQLIGALGEGSKSFGVVAHSQGGPATLHLYTFYWSGLDWAEGGRLIQSVGSPYQGTPIAGNLAGLGEVFGTGCGTNFDLSVDGSAMWLASIPTASRQKVHYYTTSFDDGFGFDFCNFFTDLFLSDPDDGVIEMARGQLPGAISRGHVEGWCHTTGMRDPAQTTDVSRNTEMNTNAAR